ncbi:MAG TPA: CYTH domain-containing protein [Terrimicrobium sp.]
MGTEIERKFLVVGNDWRAGASGTSYIQGYLSRDVARIVRIRQAGPAAYLTIKGIAQGASRPEFEYPIPLSDARQLMNLCLRPLVEKTRYVIKYASKRWEVDEFRGDNRGLILAEIELSREDEAVDIPPWIGQEVSGDPRYFNSYLSEHPYTQWHPNKN